MRSEMNTQFANIATPSEIVLSVSFTVELSGNTADLHICMPYSMIEPIRDTLNSTMHSEQASSDKRWTGMLTRQLQTAEVELVAPLASAELSLGDIAKMQVGDVIPLSINDNIEVTVDGVPVLECRYGTRDGQYALKVERFLANETSE
jgi:flagellar motor switch protein FliM